MTHVHAMIPAALFVLTGAAACASAPRDGTPATVDVADVTASPSVSPHDEAAPRRAAKSKGRTDGPELPEPSAWSTDPEAATRLAAKEGRPMILVFSAAWSAQSVEMTKHTWVDPRVRAAGTGFVAVLVDRTDVSGDPIAEHYRVNSAPVVILFGSDGEEKARFTRFMEPEDLAQALRSVE